MLGFDKDNEFYVSDLLDADKFPKQPEIPEELLEELEIPDCYREPVFVSNKEVWAVAALALPLSQNPWYAFFYCGTNDLRILKYDDEELGWYQISLSEDIPDDHLHGLLWKWSCHYLQLELDKKNLQDKLADISRITDEYGEY